jgi:hypothetical protein
MMPLQAQLCHANIAVDTDVRGLPTTAVEVDAMQRSEIRRV